MRKFCCDCVHHGQPTGDDTSPCFEYGLTPQNGRFDNCEHYERVTCPFYELDEAAKDDGDEMDAAYYAGRSAEDIAAEKEFWLDQQFDGGPDPFAKCGEYCAHMRGNPGFPGEFVYSCAAPGNEHIIHVDFNENAIR